MEEYIDLLKNIFAIGAMILVIGIPYFIVIQFKIENIRKKKEIEKNSTHIAKYKEIYNHFLTNKNFRNKKENRILYILSLSNNFVLIIYSIVYIISAIFILFTDFVIETAVANIIFNVFFWFIKLLSYFMIDVKNPTSEEFETEIIPMYLKYLFPKYEFESKGKLKRDNYKFYISKDSYIDNNRWYKYSIDSNEIELHDICIHTAGKTQVNGDFSSETASIAFNGIYGVVKLNKPTNIQNIELLHKKPKHHKNRINGLNYSVYSDDKHTLELLLTDELKQKLNRLRKKYKFDFCIENGKYLYFQVEDYNSFAITAIYETDFIYNFIKTNEIFTEIENVIKEFLKNSF